MDLTGKTAIVTGAASGIGAAIVQLFLEANARVVAVDQREPAVPEELSSRFGERLRCVTGDVAQEATAAAYTRTALDAFGRIDVMVNNAGLAVVKTIAEHTPEEWDRVLSVNVKSMYWSARYIVPVMQRQGGGLFLNTGSISSVVGLPAQGAYGPAKGAVVQLTRQMAIDYAADGIRVNAICPGTVDTPLVRQAAEDSGDADGFMARLQAGHPLGRIAQPEEIAQLYLFLASDRARFFTGAVIMLDGGYTAQ